MQWPAPPRRECRAADFLCFVDRRLWIPGDRCDVATDLAAGGVLTTVRAARHLQSGATICETAGGRETRTFMRAHLVVTRGKFLEPPRFCRIGCAHRLFLRFLRRFPRGGRRPG